MKITELWLYRNRAEYNDVDWVKNQGTFDVEELFKRSIEQIHKCYDSEQFITTRPIIFILSRLLTPINNVRWGRYALMESVDFFRQGENGHARHVILQSGAYLKNKNESTIQELISLMDCMMSYGADYIVADVVICDWKNHNTSASERTESAINTCLDNIKISSSADFVTFLPGDDFAWGDGAKKRFNNAYKKDVVTFEKIKAKILRYGLKLLLEQEAKKCKPQN